MPQSPNVYLLNFSDSFCPLDSLIRPREPSTNQGGANVRSCDIQAHLGLGLQPDNVAHTVLKSRPQAAFKPIEQKIFISLYHPHLLGHTR